MALEILKVSINFGSQTSADGFKYETPRPLPELILALTLEATLSMRTALSSNLYTLLHPLGWSSQYNGPLSLKRPGLNLRVVHVTKTYKSDVKGSI